MQTLCSQNGKQSEYVNHRARALDLAGLELFCDLSVSSF